MLSKKYYKNDFLGFNETAPKRCIVTNLAFNEYFGEKFRHSFSNFSL